MPLELNQESLLSNEQATIEEAIKVCKELTEVLILNDHPVKRRAGHSKQHGCVKGELIVEANLPAELQIGIFKQPTTYPVWVRFSNSFPHTQSDVKPDFRGLSIKLIDEPQDFLLFNSPNFPAKDTLEFVEFMRAVQKKRILSYFFPSFNPSKWRLKQLRVLLKLARQPVLSPLTIDYWSAVPYLLGSRAVKYQVKSHSSNRPHFPIVKSDNYLREVMIQQLKNQEAHFDFLIQFQTDPNKTPIEDALIEWTPALSPFYKVATLKIASQVFDTPEREEFGENLSFTPWRCLPEHKPIGNINRARKQIYEAMSQFRHEQ